MADSPSLNRDIVLTYTVYCDGKALDDSFELVFASVRLGLNRIGKATLKFNAGSMESGEFPESDSKSFKPGASLRLDVGDVNKLDTIFEGTIVDVGLKIGRGFRSQMVVECRDNAFSATQGRKNRIFEKKSDSDIIKEVLGDYGCSLKVDSTSYKHAEMVQYYATDWDFALSRAEASGLYISTVGKTISALKPNIGAGAVLSVTLGVDLIDFNVSLSDSGIYSKYKAISWDSATQAEVNGEATAQSLNKQGDLTDKQIASKESMILQSDAPLESAALKQWANSVALRAGLARYRGTFSFYGSAKALPGCLVELKGFGARFNGEAFVGGVKHTIEKNSWLTTLTLGIDSLPVSEQSDFVAPSAAGLLPGVEGVHSAVVKKLDGDPQKENRIQIELPWMEGEKKLLWARLSLPYATAAAGIFFLPELGDEVIVGFVNHDPCHPIILGALHSKKNAPIEENTAENNKKYIITREKLTIEFDEENKLISIFTPSGNRVDLSDKDKSIKLSDENKNEILMNKSGISLSSAKDIKLTAKGAITLDAMKKISHSAKQDVSLEGLNVKVQAKVGACVKGNATAELSASGQTTVKGAMVMIN